MRCGLIGASLGHSFSKEIQEKLGRYAYELIELAPGELEAAGADAIAADPEELRNMLTCGEKLI